MKQAEFIDSHAHLYLKQFDQDRAEVIKSAKNAGITRILLPNIDLDTIDAMHLMSDPEDSICDAMMGLHPCSVKPDFHEVLDQMEKCFEQREYVAVGETGVDLYWDVTYQKEQIEAFKRQIDWAKAMQLPIVIHSRDSLDLNIGIIEELQDGRLTGVFHCFNGNVDQAQRIVDCGFMMGLGGVVTFKNSGMSEVLDQISKDHVILETDAPYLTPVPFRGKRNESAYVRHVAQFLSGKWAMSLEEVGLLTCQNTRKLFSSLLTA